MVVVVVVVVDVDAGAVYPGKAARLAAGEAGSGVERELDCLHMAGLGLGCEAAGTVVGVEGGLNKSTLDLLVVVVAGSLAVGGVAVASGERRC